MKGMTLVLRCQLCLTIREVSVGVYDKVELPEPWTARGGHIGSSTAKLYTEWGGTNGQDVFPRLFCCDQHREIFVAAEQVAAEAAHAEGLKVAQRFFTKAMRREMIKAMDAVTALATVARDGDE